MKDKRILFIGGNHGMGLAEAKIACNRGAEAIIASRDDSTRLMPLKRTSMEKQAITFVMRAIWKARGLY